MLLLLLRSDSWGSEDQEDVVTTGRIVALVQNPNSLDLVGSEKTPSSQKALLHSSSLS